MARAQSEDPEREFYLAVIYSSKSQPCYISDAFSFRVLHGDFTAYMQISERYYHRRRLPLHKRIAGLAVKYEGEQRLARFLPAHKYIFESGGKGKFQVVPLFRTPIWKKIHIYWEHVRRRREASSP